MSKEPANPLQEELTSRDGGFGVVASSGEGSDHEAKSIKDEDLDEEERDRFSNSYAFVLTGIAFTVGLGNVWKFPNMAYDNGGVAFLIPYICLSIVFGIPIVYMEIAIGQFCQSGPGTVFFKYMPAFQGIGWAMAAIAFLFMVYYYVIIAWVLVYLCDLISGQSYLWTRCRNQWNSDVCESLFDNNECSSINTSLPYYFNGSCHSLIYKDLLSTANVTTRFPSEDYFENSVLMRSAGIHDTGGMNWQIFGCMIILWVVCALIQWGGVSFIGKFNCLTSPIPFVLGIILFIRGVTLPGASKGLDHFIFRPDFQKLGDIDTWKTALSQVCFSLSIGYGGHQTLASFNKREHNCFRDSVLIVLGDTVMSLIGGIVVFSFLGFYSSQTGKSMDDVVQSGFSLAFIGFPEALSNVPLAWLWGILFYLMLAFLGTSCVILHSLTVITCFLDQYPSLVPHRIWVGCGVCSAAFVVGIPMHLKSGIYWLTLFDECSCGFGMCLVLLLEIIIVVYCYGVQNFAEDLQLILGESTTVVGRLFGKTGAYYRINWMTTSPFFVMVMTFLVLARPELTYGKNSRKYIFPAWSEILGWFLSCSVLCFIPYFLAKNIWKVSHEQGNVSAAFTLHPSHPSYSSRRLKSTVSFMQRLRLRYRQQNEQEITARGSASYERQY